VNDSTVMKCCSARQPKSPETLAVVQIIRQRQVDRPPEVPTNIERQNRRSVLRSEKAAGDTSPAGETGVPDPVRDVISSRGRSLDGSIQRAMEDRMDDSFGDVRIHTGSTAAAACESINARAFTVGNHIAFNSGEYDPESPEGQHVLAHELAHVRQQNQGAVSMLPQEDVELEVDPDPALEREAEETAQQVMEGGELGIQRMAGTDVHIQRAGFGSLAQSVESTNTWGPTEGSSQSDQSHTEEVNLVADEVKAEPEALAEEVKQIKTNQAKLFAEVTNERGTADVLGEAAGKGVAGTTIGLAVTAATANPIAGALAAGAMSDVGKTLYGKMWGKGREAVGNAEVPEIDSERLGGIKQSIEDLVDEKVRQRLDGIRTDGSEDPTGVRN